MPTLSKRVTVYFDPEIHKALKLKAVETSLSVSELIDQAIRHEFTDDEEDLAVIASRVAEKTVSYEAVLKELKADGKI